MRDRSSFIRCSSECKAMNAIAIEARDMVRRAAEPVRPGETIKAQMRRAERALGYASTERWRVRAAWYGEAGCWGAGAFRDLQERYRGWIEDHRRREAAATDLVRARAHTLRSTLAATDSEFHSETIQALDRAIGLLGRGD